MVMDHGYREGEDKRENTGRGGRIERDGGTGRRRVGVSTGKHQWV